MNVYAKSINDHYSQAGLGEKILAAYERAGKNVHTLTRDDLSSFDEFHIGGREATRELARLAGLQAGMKVLDLGSGVGGPARTLAAEFGCEVVGLDIVEDYCLAAEMLTARVGLSDSVTFRHGDVMNMPFGEASLDVVWSQHTMMNIADKARLFDEIRRVLRPQGRLALHEVCEGPISAPHFPVPWASDPAISFLVTPEELRHMLGHAGFAELVWKDVTAPSLAWFRQMIANMAARSKDAPQPLGLNLLMGERTAEKAANVVRNLEEDRIRVVEGVLKLMK